MLCSACRDSIEAEGHAGGAPFRPCAVPPDTTLTVGGRTWSARQLAMTYRPVFLLARTHTTPPLLQVGYEVIPEPGHVMLLFYPVWADEQHPQPFLHATYAAYRRLRYGSVRDIEFVQLRLDRTTGALTELLFETAPGTPFSAAVVEHSRLRLIRDRAGLYAGHLTTPDGEERRRAPMALPTRGPRLRLLVQTWNHLQRLPEPREQDLRPLEAALVPITLDFYKAFRLHRRSQGDLRGEHCEVMPRPERRSARR